MEDLLLAFRLIAHSKKKQSIAMPDENTPLQSERIYARQQGGLSTSEALKVYRDLFGRTSHGEVDFGSLAILHQMAAHGDNGGSSHSERGFASLPLNADETREVTPPLPTIRLGRRGHVPGTSHAHILPSSLSAQSQEFHRIVRSVGTI
jgi:hypothetical protein